MTKLVRKLQSNKVGAVLVDVFDWYPAHYPSAERKLLRKLDLCILVFACLSFFCKYLDQTNITNAYVSGMEEEIGAYGNDLNYFNVAYYVAYVVGQIPLMTLQTKPHLAPYLLPTLEVVWSILTFCESRVSKPWHLYIIRAMVGFFEAPSFGGTHFILGSWYRKEELFKRAGVWFMGNALGSCFSGYLQAAAYNNLNGVHGLSGWRWLFLIDGIITLPIAFIGYAFFPGLPNSPKRWFFSDDELTLARERMPKDQGLDEGINWEKIKFTLKRPMWWICVPAYVCMIQSSYWLSYMSLWIKADVTKNVTLINVLPTIVYIVQAFSSWLGTTFAATVSIWFMWTWPNFWVFFSSICLTIWNIPIGLKFFCWYVGGFSGMSSPIFYSWINSTLRGSPAERGLIISSCMTFGYTSYAVIPLFTFPTTDAPRFPKGYPPTIAFTFGLWAIVTFGIWYMRRRAPNADVERRGSDDTLQGEEEKSVSEEQIVTPPSERVDDGQATGHHHGEGVLQASLQGTKVYPDEIKATA